MEIRRNTSSGGGIGGGGGVTYSVFVPMRCERTGKYGFPVQFVGYIADGGFDIAMNGVVDECHRRRYGMSFEERDQVPQ